jgi:TPR repeat protein
MLSESPSNRKLIFTDTLKEARIGFLDAQYQVGLMYANGLGVSKNIRFAIEWVTKAAERGHQAAQYLLATRFESGIGVERDLHKAVIWYSRAAENGNIKANFRLGKIYATVHAETSRRLIEQAALNGLVDAQFALSQSPFAVDNKGQETLKWLQLAAEQGFAPAQHAMGNMYATGQFLPQNLDLACNWYRLAASQDFPASQLALEEIDAAGMGRTGSKVRARKKIPSPDRRQARERWAGVAEHGDAEARFHLGVMHEKGLGLEQDPKKAISLYRLAARQGEPCAQLAMGRLLEKSSLEDAISWYQKAALQGQAEAHFALGRLGLTGNIDLSDTLDSMLHYCQAASSGNTNAMIAIGSLGEAAIINLQKASLQRAAKNGVVTAQIKLAKMLKSSPEHAADAMAWFKLAAEQGSSEAQTELALGYLSGRGIAKDAVLAANWFSRAADAGDPCAQWNLSAILASGGKGIDADLKSAFKWCLTAAEQDFVAAQASLGTLYAQMGEVKKAIHWWEKAAIQGDPESKFNIAQTLLKGDGSQGNALRALELLRQAAEDGLVDAQSRLGILYATGEGGVTDVIEAHKWFWISANVGDPSAIKNLERSTEMLSKAQGNEGAVRARTWLARRQKQVK